VRFVDLLRTAVMLSAGAATMLAIVTVLGASRGEPGILGEGIRHALMRDPTYEPALAAARALLG